MSTTPTLEEQIAMAGLTYGRRHDISYRTGLVLQVLGTAVLAVLYPLQSPFYTAGIMIFEAGVLLSAIYLLVWMSWVKKMILGSVVIGIGLQIGGLRAGTAHGNCPHRGDRLCLCRSGRHGRERSVLLRVS
jgi:hypothetical protein